MPKLYNMTLRNLEYRLRAFRDYLPDLLQEAVREKEDVIVSAIVDDQLYRRGITGTGEKIMDYMPYSARTKVRKLKKGQPATRVTLRDSGAFHKAMGIVYEDDGFRITSEDYKTKWLVRRYGPEIFKLTNDNLNRILRVHIRRYIEKRVRQIISEVKR